MEPQVKKVVKKGLAERLLPYSRLVGQEQLKVALELAYITPRLGGVLVSGHRGTAKSTAVRAFARMLYGRLPVTLPINATEDRVVGGWEISALMNSKAVWKPGLLEEADGSMLYVDEVNLLDDHIVNIILDVTATGILEVQREGQGQPRRLAFTLVGTMNPEEGGLRPQLLDRFGLMVDVKAITNQELRRQVLQTVLAYDQALHALEQGMEEDPFLTEGCQQDAAFRDTLHQARSRLEKVVIPDKIAEYCVSLANTFQVEGHRAEYTLALAAKAYAARDGATTVTTEHLKQVAPLALQHRRPEALQSSQPPWNEVDDTRVNECLTLA